MRRTVLLLLVSTMLGLPVLSNAQPGCSWASETATTRDAILFGVDAIDASSAWAVGSVFGADDWERTLVRHWNGTAWETQASPTVKEQSNRLNDVVGLPDGTAWAVGGGSRTTLKTIVQRYDGTRWRWQRSLNPSQTLNTLDGVDATPGGTVYAVGSRWNARRQYRTMIQRFDGETWRLVPGRHPGLFYDVDAIDDDDVWVVGSKSVDRGARVFALHYDGATWTEAGLPVVSGRYSGLFGVSAAAPDDVWAVGHYQEDGTTRPLVLHFDGTGWSISELPDLGPRSIELRGVAAVSQDFAVAVGQRTDYGYQEDSRVILEWNGSSWSEAPRDDELESNWLQAVDVTPDRSAWAVGYHSTRPQTSYVARRTCS